MIKKYITGLLLALSVYSYSQENKNKFVANATIQFNYWNGSNTINLGGVNMGYFISNHFALGISGNYSREKSNSATKELNYSSFTENTTSSSYSGIFARYNYVPAGNKLGFFFNFGSGYSLTTIKLNHRTIYDDISFEQTNVQKRHGFNIALSPGIIYFINKRFSTEATLGNIAFRTEFSKDVSPTEATYRYTNFETRFFTSYLMIGFSYYFDCKKNEAPKTTEQ